MKHFAIRVRIWCNYLYIYSHDFGGQNAVFYGRTLYIRVTINGVTRHIYTHIYILIYLHTDDS